MESKKRFILPKLSDSNKDLNKRWFVYYSYFNEKENKLKRIKVYENINIKKTIDDRLKEAKILIDELTNKLMNGYNPFHEKINNQGIITEEVFYLTNILLKYFDKRKDRLRKKTVSTYLTKIKDFNRWVDKNYSKIELKDFDKIKALQYIEFLQQRKTHNTTLNNYIITLKSFFDEMIDDEIIGKNPFLKIKKFNSVKEGKLPFKDYHKEQLKKEIIKEDIQLWMFIQFMYYCFIRPAELRLLKIESLDIEGKIITINGSISKNKKTQSVGIPIPLLSYLKKEELQRFPEDFYIFGKQGCPGIEPVGINHFSSVHRRITRRLHFSNRYTLYSWKTTGAVAVARDGKVSMKDLQLQLRHSSLEITDMYLQSIGITDNKVIMKNFPKL